MTPDKVLKEFRAAGALLEGHFVLSSGLHSPVFLQKAFVFMDPKRTARLCKALAGVIRDRITRPFDTVLSPAVGGIVPGYETARHLGVPAMYAERENGAMTIRRGFPIGKGVRVLIVEDIVTTGLSTRETVAAVRATGATVAGAAALIDRSGGKAKVGVPFVALATLDIPTYAPDALPPELAAIPPTKPGSRALSAKP